MPFFIAHASQLHCTGNRVNVAQGHAAVAQLKLRLSVDPPPLQPVTLGLLMLRLYRFLSV